MLVFLCADGIEGLFCRELGIKYTEFEHIVVSHVSSMWYVMWVSCDISCALRTLCQCTDWAGLAICDLCLHTCQLSGGREMCDFV